MEREIKNVAVYVRKSRDEETTDALKRQRSVLVDLCEKNNWNYDVYFEVGSSQQIENPELQKMLTKIQSFNYDGVVISDLDRLSRNLVNSGMIKEVFINAGCLAITPTKVYDYTKQDDDLFSDLQFVLAKNEYQTIKRRLIRGVRQSAKDGNWQGKRSPVGYKYNKDTKRLEKTEDAPIIKQIFDNYAKGMSTMEIAEKFRFENVTTSTGIIWTPAGISRILNNPVYMGTSVFGKTTSKNGKRGVRTLSEDQIITKNTHEPIVSETEWELVQKIKKDKTSSPIPLAARKHKFSGLIKCGLCGRTHSFQTSKYKNRRICSCQTRNYADNSIEQYTICPNEGMNVADFDKNFHRRFKKRVEELGSFIDIIKNHGNKELDYKSQIQSYEKQIKRIEQDIKRVQQGFISQIFTEEQASEQIKNFNAKKEQITQDVVKLKEIENSSSVNYYESILNKMESFVLGVDQGIPERDLNFILKELVDYIEYTKIGRDIKAKIYWKHDIEGELK